MGRFDMAFWKEFFDALYPDHHYENLKSPLLLIDLNYILIGLYAGIVLGLIIMCYRKVHLGKAVRALLKSEALSEDCAKTPAELGLDKNRSLVRALRKRRFGGIVKQLGVDNDKKKPDFSEERYYIPEEVHLRAEDLYSKRGVNIVTVVIWAVLLIPVFMLLRYVIPELLLLLDGIL